MLSIAYALREQQVESKMSADKSNNDANGRQQEIPIVPRPDAKHERGDDVENRGQADRHAETKAGNSPKQSRFQRFMHKHFPDAKPHDRWQLVFTFVIAVSTFFYTIFAGWTLREIASGSVDTHNLAVAASQQASHTEEIAEAAQDQ